MLPHSTSLNLTIEEESWIGSSPRSSSCLYHNSQQLYNLNRQHLLHHDQPPWIESFPSFGGFVGSLASGLTSKSLGARRGVCSLLLSSYIIININIIIIVITIDTQ